MWAVFAQLLVVIGLGTVALFSGILAKRVRRRKWVEFPDGREVAPYLPQLITLLAGPAYFVAMIILFVQAATAFPGILPTAGWLDALLLSLDNFVRTEIFFNAAECFHLRFDGEVEDRFGKSLVFISRLPMDLAFIKLAVQLLNAAYYRAQDQGRGEDILFTINQEIKAGDVPRVKELCQEVGDSLRDAVDTLRHDWEEAGDKSAMAWRCLVTMKDYAIPYLNTRYRAATGDERERIAKLIDRLENAPVEDEKQPPTRPWLLIVLAAGLVLGAAVSFVLSGAAALVITALITALASWMVAGSRGWIDRLVRWRVLLPSTPNRLVWLQVRWALCLLPLLLIAWSRLFQLVAGSAPCVFGGADLEEVNYPSTLIFVLDNLRHMQIFVTIFEIYGIRIADLHQEGFLGGLLVFLLRLVLNVGIIGLLMSFRSVWFNRVFRKFAVSPNAELALRQEAAECGPQAAALVGYHLDEIRSFLVKQMKNHQDEEMLVALALSGFLKDFQRNQQGEQGREETAARKNNLGIALVSQGLLEEATLEYRQAINIWDGLVCAGQTELQNELAGTHVNLGRVLARQGQMEEAVGELRLALEIYHRLVDEGRTEILEDMARTRGNLGAALASQGKEERLKEASAEYRQSLEIFEHLVREGRTELQEDIAGTQVSFGNALEKQGHLEQAAAEYRLALEYFARQVPSGRVDSLEMLAFTRWHLADALRKQGRLQDAVAEFRQAVEIRERLLREGRTELLDEQAATRACFGLALEKQGNLEEAAAQYGQVVEIYERLVREGRIELLDKLAFTRGNIGNVMVNQGRLEEAVAEFRRSLEISERLVSEGRSESRDDVAQTRMNLGIALATQGRTEEAVAEFARQSRFAKGWSVRDASSCWTNSRAHG